MNFAYVYLLPDFSFSFFLFFFLRWQGEVFFFFFVCVCVFFPFILDIKFVGRTSRGHRGGRSHGISHPPSFCGACLNFSYEKDSAHSFPSSTVKSNFVY